MEEGKHHEVQGTVAIVTGGNGGLGQRICHALAQAGSHIAVVYTQSQAQAQEVAGQLRQTGVQAEAMVYNVPGRSVWSSEPACSLLHPRSSPARAPGGLPSYRPPHSVRYVLHYVKALGSKRVIFPALIDEADVPMGRGFLS